MNQKNANSDLSIFVSHSTKDSEQDQQLLNQLCDRLAEEGYHVICDRDYIKIGEEWRFKLLEGLALCDAAVILFSPAALKSDWVIAESVILGWRKRLEPKFRIFPVLLHGICPTDLKKGPLSPVMIDEIQALSLMQPTVATTVDQIWSVIEKQMEKHPISCCDDSRIAQLAEVISQHLDELPCRGLEKIMAGWCPEIPAHWQERYSLQFRAALVMVKKGIKAFGELCENSYQSPSESKAMAIIEHLKPGWVAPLAATQVLAITGLADHGKRALAVPCQNEGQIRFVAEMYIRQACFLPRDKYFQLMAVSRDGRMDESLDGIRRKLTERLFSMELELNQDVTDKDINQRLEANGKLRPYFLICSNHLMNDDFIQKVRDTFGSLTLFFCPLTNDTILDGVELINHRNDVRKAIQELSLVREAAGLTARENKQ